MKIVIKKEGASLGAFKMPDNKKRAMWGKAALRAHSKLVGDLKEPIESQFVDLLANLRHAAARDGVDFDDALRTSEGHFNAEVYEESVAPMVRRADIAISQEIRNRLKAAYEGPMQTSSVIFDKPGTGEWAAVTRYSGWFEVAFWTGPKDHNRDSLGHRTADTMEEAAEAIEEWLKN